MISKWRKVNWSPALKNKERGHVDFYLGKNSFSRSHVLKTNFQKMATSKQEQLYNEIVEYYNYADRLLSAVEDNEHELATQQFSIIEDVVNKLEECADTLTTQYIDFIKNGESEKNSEAIRCSLNDIMAKIEECRNKTLMLYHLDEAEKDIKM